MRINSITILALLQLCSMLLSSCRYSDLFRSPDKSPEPPKPAEQSSSEAPKNKKRENSTTVSYSFPGYSYVDRSAAEASNGRQKVFPLHEACLDGDVEAAKKLIARGLNVNQKNAFGSTPLSYAILKLDYEMIALLLDRGASPNCVLTTDGFTRSALANAIWHNDELLVEALINAGADINFRSVFGQTDAHRIASFTAEMLKQLIQVGLDVNMRDFAGKTAYDFLTLARVQQGEEVADEIAEVLKQYTQQ